MRFVAAYLLAVLGGNKNPSAKDIEKILGSVGIEIDQQRLAKVVSELNGKNVDELIEKGKTKLSSVPSGGAVSAVAAPTASTEASKDEPKKAEQKEESEESDEDMGFGLFD